MAEGEFPRTEPSHVLGVFGLSRHTTEDALRAAFAPHGALRSVHLVSDKYTRLSRGFAFVYYETLDDATAARAALNGAHIDGRCVRVDYSATLRPHDPTPGRYMGERRRSPPRRHGDSYAPARRARDYASRDRGRSHSDRSYGARDRPHYDRPDRPYRDRDRSYGDRERPYDDRERSYGDRPYGDREYSRRDDRGHRRDGRSRSRDGGHYGARETRDASRSPPRQRETRGRSRSPAVLPGARARSPISGFY